MVKSRSAQGISLSFKVYQSIYLIINYCWYCDVVLFYKPGIHFDMDMVK